MLNKKNGMLFFVIIVLMITKNSFAQPNWTFDPANFEYTMTMTGVGIIQCKETIDENDMVAAFIDGDVRGVQLFNGTSNNRNYAYLTVYDSIFSGNKVTFKLYDASEDKIVDVTSSIVFTENGNFGNDENPFVFETGYDSLSFYLSHYGIYKYANIGDSITTIYTSNKLNETFPSNYEFVNDSLGADNFYFSLNGKELVLQESIQNLSQQKLYIHLKSTSSTGCILDIHFILTIQEEVSTINSNSESGNDIIIYPNPASDFISISSKIKFESILLYDPIRNSYSKINIESGNRISLNHLSNQIYYLVFQNEGARQVRNVVVVR